MKTTRKILGTVIAASIAIGAIPLVRIPTKAEHEITPSRAVKTIMAGVSGIEGGQKSNIYYGNYQQERIRLEQGQQEPKGEKDVDWRKCETATRFNTDGFYQINPIKWRVLEKDEEGNDKNIFLLSDKNIDVFWFDQDAQSNEVGTNPNVWRISPIREWLNGTGSYQKPLEGQREVETEYSKYQNFIDYAFSEEEKGYIKPTTITTNGEITEDKIFLLEINDVINTGENGNNKYGFGVSGAGNKTRESINTSYVVGGGKTGGQMYNLETGVGEAGRWWLRSPGNHK